MGHLFRYRHVTLDRFLSAISQLTFTCWKSTNETLRKRCEMCLKLTIKTPEQRCDVVLVFLLTLDTLHIFFQCFYFSSVFIDFEQEHVSWVNVYLNDLKVNRRIHLSTDVWGIIPICFVEKKNTPEKNPFMAATVRWSIKYFFAPNYPIFRKSLDKGKNK